MRVKLTYYKQSGKYYSEGELHLPETPAFMAYQRIKQLHEDGDLPGLMHGACKEFFVVAESEDWVGAGALFKPVECVNG